MPLSQGLPILSHVTPLPDMEFYHSIVGSQLPLVVSTLILCSFYCVCYFPHLGSPSFYSVLLCSSAIWNKLPYNFRLMNSSLGVSSIIIIQIYLPFFASLKWQFHPHSPSHHSFLFSSWHFFYMNF